MQHFLYFDKLGTWLYMTLNKNLDVIVWIPVHVINNDCVGRCQVNAETTRTC